MQELLIHVTTNGSNVTVAVNQITGSDAWNWDHVNGKVVYQYPEFSHSATIPQTVINDTILGYGSPNSYHSGNQGVLPWGRMEIKITVGSTVITDKIVNFTDQNWTSNTDNYYPGADTHIYIVGTSAVTYTTTTFPNHTNFNSADTTIWGLWGYQDYIPLQTNLNPPIFLTNIINGANAGGKLHIGTDSYNSGDIALKSYGYSYNIGTNVKGDTNIDRFINYSGITYKHNNWAGVASDYSLSRSVPVTRSNNQQSAVFIPVSSIILKNSLDGTAYTGSGAGNIPFVDPWYVANSNGSQPDTAVRITSGNSPTGAYNQSSGGVFLGQPYGGSSPFYSLQAPVSQTINSHTGFFGGWGASPNGYAAFQNATSPTTGVTFNTAGATITANYIYSVVASNATLQMGTYTFAGSLTINSGATLTLTSGTTLNFPSGASLVVNGALSANGVTFTSTSGSWTGISLNHDGSSITNCTISAASSPLTITNVNTATITGGYINNSAFSGTQAISVSNSTPMISNVEIDGLPGSSSNGVRYTTGRGGTLQESTIRTSGAGNGIVIQGNASPTISGCIIDTNYFYGIIVTSDGSGTPLITGNTFYGNGTHGSTRQYFNIYFNASGGTVQLN